MTITAATVFSVTDMPASLAFYRDVVGFEVAFEYGAPVSYAGLCLGEATLHLIDARHTPRRPGHGAICLFVPDVDALHAGIVARGAVPTVPLGDRDYGMRDVNFADPDGNQITIGAALP